MIEAVLVGNDADVRQTTKEYKRSKLELLLDGRRLEARKQIASAHSFEVDPGRLEDGPHES